MGEFLRKGHGIATALATGANAVHYFTSLDRIDSMGTMPAGGSSPGVMPVAPDIQPNH